VTYDDYISTDLSDRGDPRKPLRYISLGAGVQSSAVLVMSALGWYDCPKADVAIFADTQDEPAYVYEYLQHLKKFGEEHGIPVEVVTAGRLSTDGTTRGEVYKDPETGAVGYRGGFLRIPGFTIGDDGRPSMLRRQCTREFKIAPIEKRVRELLGFKKRQRIPKHAAEALIGISRDEIQRVKDSQTPWVRNRYPLIDAGLYRGNCIEIARRGGLPTPRKSACVFCPYHDDAYWREIREESPAEFAAACDYDDRIRDSSQAGCARPVFLHRSLKALREVDLSVDATPQLDFGFQNECEGMCGV
jgi:hypothetical protein